MSKDNTKPFAKHNGVQIFITEGGQFVAEVNGERMTRPSVAAIKKLIEKKATFEPFAAIDEARVHGHADVTKGTIKTLTIVGAKKNPRGSSWANNLWIDDKGQTHSTVIPDTPENRAAMQAVIDKRFEIAKIEAKLAEELRALESKLVRRNLDSEIKRAEADKAAAANGSDKIEVGNTYSVDHSRKGKFVLRVTKIGDDFVEGEIVAGEAVMLSKYNENGQPGDMLAVRADLAKWSRVEVAK
jgi:hypothetical protein